MSNESDSERLAEMGFLRFPIETRFNMLFHRLDSFLTNVDRTGFDLPLGIPSDPGEFPLARVRTTDGKEVFLSNSRISSEGEGSIAYRDMASVHIMAETIRGLTPMEVRRMKREHFHRLILKGIDGSTVVFEHLDHAVLLLWRFLEWQLLWERARSKGIL